MGRVRIEESDAYPLLVRERPPDHAGRRGGLHEHSGRHYAKGTSRYPPHASPFCGRGEERACPFTLLRDRGPASDRDAKNTPHPSNLSVSRPRKEARERSSRAER